jgi:uncharacterized protein (DUF362 family)
MNQFSRRQFLESGVKAALAAGASPLLTGCPTGLPPFNPTDATTQVAAVRGRDLDTMARDALAAHGGAEAIVNADETVFIKPNFVTHGLADYDPARAGETVKPEIVVAVAEECLKAGAREVIIGDAAQVESYSWSNMVFLDGSSDMATEAAYLTEAYPGTVSLACLETDSPAWDTIPSYTMLGSMCVSSLVARADRIISIGVIKSHTSTQITATLKNFVGVTSNRHYGAGAPLRFLLHIAGIEQCFLDIVDGLKPDFALIDCSIGVEGNGPTVSSEDGGTTVDMRDRLGDWLILSGPDLTAVDATAARVIGLDVETIKQFNDAYNRGLGQIHEDHIAIDGATLGELQVDWEPAGLG